MRTIQTPLIRAVAIVAAVAAGIAGAPGVMAEVIDDELAFSIRLARAGFLDLAEDRIRAVVVTDPVRRVEVLVDVLAGVRLERGIALAVHVGTPAIDGADSLFLEEARAALEGAIEAVGDGRALAAEMIADLTPRQQREVDELTRFGLIRHAEAMLELALLEAPGSFGRALRLEAAHDAATTFLWDQGDSSVWSPAAYLVLGRVDAAAAGDGENVLVRHESALMALGMIAAPRDGADDETAAYHADLHRRARATTAEILTDAADRLESGVIAGEELARATAIYLDEGRLERDVAEVVGELRGRVLLLGL